MNNRRAIAVLAVYLAMVAVAAYVATLGKFAGVYLVALTLPWSLFGVLLVDAVDTKLLDNLAWGIGISLIGVMANSFIIYRLLSKRRAREDSKHAA
ncbi:MAG: SCO4225 family membrane protein [Gemmatimonadaceae bacterium]